MKNNSFSIGDIVCDTNSSLFFVLNNNSIDGTCIIVRKSGKYATYFDYLNDDNTNDWDIKHTEKDVNCDDFKLVKSISQQQDELNSK
jgi:hypothetical protein